MTRGLEAAREVVVTSGDEAAWIAEALMLVGRAGVDLEIGTDMLLCAPRDGEEDTRNKKTTQCQILSTLFS